MPVPTNASLLMYLFASISASSVVGLILSTPLPSWPDDRLNATPTVTGGLPVVLEALGVADLEPEQRRALAEQRVGRRRLASAGTVVRSYSLAGRSRRSLPNNPSMKMDDVLGTATTVSVASQLSLPPYCLQSATVSGLLTVLVTRVAAFRLLERHGHRRLHVAGQRDRLADRRARRTIELHDGRGRHVRRPAGRPARVDQEVVALLALDVRQLDAARSARPSPPARTPRRGSSSGVNMYWSSAPPSAWNV